MKNRSHLLSNGARQFWCVVVALSAAGAAAGAADWPQLLGPKSNGTSAEKGLLRAWPSDGPKVLWTVPTLGPGYAGAAIRDSKVYFLDRVEQKKDALRCLDLSSGKELWTFGYDAPGRIDHEGSRCTPAVNEKYAFIVGPFGQMHCIDIATHGVVWKKNILTDFHGDAPRWQVCQSPLLYKDMVIFAPQTDQAGIVAFDQATGKEKWRSKSIGPMAYGSPMLIQVDGVDQFVIVNTLGAAAVSSTDGKNLWDFAHPCKIPVPNVTVVGNGKMFITGGYAAGSSFFQVTHEGDKWVTKETAKIDKIGGHCHPALVYQDHVYLLCNVNERSDGMVCFDFEGKMAWQTKNAPNLDKGGSILTADGLIYVMDGKTGELHIVQPSPAEFKSLGKFKLLDGREIWGPLALSGGKLVIRDQSQIKCVDIQGK